MAMASSPDTDASEIRRKGRQRLIGAIAIALLLVVFVPMLLDPEPREERRVPSLSIPSKANAPLLPAPSRPAPERAAVPEKAGAGNAAPVAAPKLEGFVVQVGAFREEVKLRQARERLTQANVPHYTERLDTAGVTRLRAGPYPSREAAESAAVVIRGAGLEGKVVPLP